MNFRNPVKTLCYGLVLGAACCVTLAPAAEAGAKADKHSEAWRRTHKALGQHLPRVEFIEVPLKDVLDFFRHVQDLPEVEIRPDWAALKRIGVTQATEANLDVRDLSVRRALELTMASTVGLGRIECVVGEDGLVHVRPAKAGPLPLPAKPTDKQLAARKRLAVKVANVDFRDAKLMDVITFLRDLSGVNIFVDWHSLGRIKVDHHSKVRLKLTDVPVRDALTGTLQAVTTKKALRWEVDTEGVVLIHALPAPPATRPAVWGLPVNGLQVGIRCKELRLKPESEVTLELSARNDGKKPLRLLRLDTYFWHNISSVSSIEFKIDGKVFRYCGPQLRPPAPPGVNAYVSIAPGAVHSAEVRIPLVNWGLNDPRGAEITFVYTNNRADAIASPFDQKTRKWKQVTGLWTGTARSGTIKLNQTEAQQRGTSREEARAREPVNGLSRTGAGEAATSEPVPQPDSENDASGAEKRDTHFWGNAVNGLQCRAWVDSKEIPFGLNLSVHYELRDAGNADIRVLRDDGYPHHVHVEWLDRKAQCSCEHKPPFMGDRIGAERFVTLKQGDTLRGRCSWWGRIESEHTEAVPEKASLRVTYFIFPEITKRYPGVWGPAPGQTDALRVSSNVVEVNLEPGLPGSRDRQNGGYSLEDAWLMADLVVQARVDSKPKPEKLVEAGYRDDETREVLLRRGVRLTVNKRLGGRKKAGLAGSVLTADYVTDPRHERALEIGEQIIALLVRRPSGDEGWILFKAVRPQDPVPSLEGKQAGQFGPAVDGVKCLLAGPRQPVSQAKPVEFAVLPRFDRESASPSTKYLDRHCEDYEVAIHFDDVKTGKIYTRRQNWEGGPPLMASLDQRRTLASDPLPPAYVRLRLLGDEGEVIPPGEYRVTAEYSGGRPEGLDEPWKKNAWRGQARSGPITLQVVSAEPFVQEVKLPTKLVLTRSPDGIRSAYSDVDMRTLKLPRRSGYHLGTRRWVKIYKGDEQVAAPGHGQQSGVPTPSNGGADVFGSLSLLPLNREALRVVVEMQVFETSQTWSHGWAVHEDPNVYKVLWKGTAEGAVTPACEPDAPEGQWGKEVKGLRSRVLLDRRSYTLGEPVWAFLDVRNDSDKSVNVARSRSMPRWFRIVGPDGKTVKPIEDVWNNRDFATCEVAPGEEMTPTQMRTSDHYQFGAPGTYRVEWIGVPTGVVKEGTTPPPAPAVTFDVLPPGTSAADAGSREDHLKYTIPRDAEKRSSVAVQPGGDGCLRIRIETDEFFMNRIKVGERVRCNGSLRETPYKDGNKHGVSRDWLQGTLVAERPYKDGKLHGVCRQWDQQGKLLGTFWMNMGTGVLKQWNEDGTREESYCRDGEVYLVRSDRAEGRMGTETPLLQGKPHGLVREWWPSGQLHSECHYSEGEKHGPETTWKENGSLWRELHYKEGKPEGTWKYYHENGKLSYQRPYRQGKLHGTLKARDKQGHLLGEFQMKHGSGVLWTWDADGRLMEGYGFPECYLDGQLVDKDYYIQASQRDPTLPKFVRPTGAADALAQGEVEPTSDVRWEVLRPVTPSELTDGEALVLRGTSPVPFELPRPEHFRLERLEAGLAWVVITFGWPERRHIQFDYPEDTKTRKVNLHLRRLTRGRERLRVMRQLRSDKDSHSVDLYAESALHAGVRYRLSWSFRLAGSDTLQTKHCEFQIGEASATQRPEIRLTPGTPGRAYLVEILFRDDDGVLFLGQTILQTTKDDDFTIAAAGFTLDGKYVSPPDPGYLTEPLQLNAVAKPFTLKPAAAERTHLYGASIDRAYARPGEVAVSISDMATGRPLPKKPIEPTIIAFSDGLHHAVFRVELLSTNASILRQDPAYWQKRTRAITAELLERRTWIKEDARRLAAAACVLRDRRVTGDLRSKLQAWIDRGEDEIKHTGFPHHLVDALVVVGSAKDVRLLEQIALRPGQASYLVWKIAPLARRIGVGPTRNLLLALLDHGGVMNANDRLKRLRHQDPSIPEPVYGDGMLLEIARSFDLDPTEFSVVMVEQRLLEMADRYPLSAREKDLCETCVKFKTGTWIMPSQEARKRGRQAMRRWIERSAAGEKGSPRSASDETTVERQDSNL